MKHMSQTICAIGLLLPLMVMADGMPKDVSDNSAVAAATAQRSANGSGDPVAGHRVIQFYTSDKSAELTYDKLGPAFGLNSSRASAGFLFNEERDNVLTGTLMYDVAWVTAPSLRLSFGTRAYAGLLSIENADVFGIAAILEAAYTLPLKQFPLALTAGVGYAPDILTFGQADRIIDWHVRAGLPLTKSVDAFAGLRFLQFDTRPGDRELDDQIHIGIRWKL